MAGSFPICGNFNFLVEIEGFGDETSSVVGGFTRVSGLSSESDVIEHRSGADMTTVKIPGRSRYANIVLEKGVTSSLELYEWRKNVEEGTADTRAGSIILLDSAMGTKARWLFYGAWPSRYDGPLLDAEDSAISVERLEIAVEKLERAL